MKKRFLALALSICVITGTLAGCSGGGNSDTGQTSADTAIQKDSDSQAEEENQDQEDASDGIQDAEGAEDAEDVVLRFSWWGGDERLEATMAVIEQFEAQYPHITVEPEYGSSDGYADKLATQLASQTAPDVIQIDPGLMPALISDETDYFVDLLEQDFDFSNFEESYYKLRINGHYGGRQLGVPTGISGGAVLVNQDLADELGFDFGTQYTWDDIFEWAKIVREYDDSMYLMCSNKEYVANVIANNYAKQLAGVPFIDEDTREINLSAEQWEEVYAFVQRLYEEEVIPPASYSAPYSGDDMQSDPNWIAGKYVCCINYMSTIEIMAEANPEPNYTAGLFPLMDGSDVDAWNANCPQVIAVNSKSDHIEEAVLFLDYFFNDETAMETLACTRSVPPTAKAREICVQSGSLSDLLGAAADVAASYQGMVDDKYFSGAEAKQIVIDEVEAIGFGVATPQGAAEETISLLENYLSSVTE